MTNQRPGTLAQERGYAMVALLILMAVMAVAMTVALPAWNTLARREREAELVFRGEQYARAIALFQRKYAGAFPPTIDVLVNERFLRKKYKDPITNDDFKTIAVGEAVVGAQTTNPLDPTGRSNAAGRTGTGAPGSRGATGNATQPGRSTFTLGGNQQPPAGNQQQTGGPTFQLGGGNQAQTGGRSTFQLGGTMGQQQGGRGGTLGPGGASAGIMGVTSKSEDESIRLYKGADHYNQWLFIGTQASLNAGGRGAQTPGEGVRGGGARPGGGGRGPNGSTPPGAPFGGSPFGRGQQPNGPGGGRSR